MTDAAARRRGGPADVTGPLVAGVLVALTIAVFVESGSPAPLPTPAFRGTVTSYCGGPGLCPVAPVVSEDFPPLVEVTVHWSDVTGGGVQFSIVGPYGAPRVCDQSGAFGACSFFSPYPGGNYTFEIEPLDNEGGQQVAFTGYYG